MADSNSGLKHTINFYEGTSLSDDEHIDSQAFYGEFKQELNWLIGFRNDWRVIEVNHANGKDSYKILIENYKPQFDKRPSPTQPMIPSKALAEITGDKPLTRVEAVAKLVDYIKSIGNLDLNKLNSDPNLKAIFQETPISQFVAGQIISKHLSL
jgi:chromatin remodeling complex protein RSC6